LVGSHHTMTRQNQVLSEASRLCDSKALRWFRVGVQRASWLAWTGLRDAERNNLEAYFMYLVRVFPEKTGVRASTLGTCPEHGHHSAVHWGFGWLKKQKVEEDSAHALSSSWVAACGHHTPASSAFECELAPAAIQECPGLQPWTEGASLVSLVLRLPTSWTEQLLASLARFSSLQMATVGQFSLWLCHTSNQFPLMTTHFLLVLFFWRSLTKTDSNYIWWE
jgi:hypothetical protein